MPKRYRVRPYQPGTLKAYWGIADRGEYPCLIANGRNGDAALLLDAFEKGKAILNHFRGTFHGFQPSFMKELEERGYDLTTLKFSIKKKEPKCSDE